MFMKDIKFVALINALLTGVYATIVALIMKNGERIFGKMDNLFGPVAFLLLFVLSAAITGALILGKPILMYLENRKPEAIRLFFYTIGWLFIIVAVILGMQIFI